MRWWSMFDAGEVGEDLARIAATGMDQIRIFLTWEDFQPEPGTVNLKMLERLVTVADVAHSVGITIMPTLFTGHMSGVDWIPGWALGGTDRDDRFRVVSGGRVVDARLRNWYSDPAMLEAQALMAGEAARALSAHPALSAWDLGNENSNCVVPPDAARARRWLAGMTEAIRDADAGCQITIGLHMEDLEENRNLGPAEAAEVCDFLTMHGYPIYAQWADGKTDASLVPFLAEITRWLGDGADVLFSEFGLPTYRPGDPAGERDAVRSPMLVAEVDAAEYTDAVVQGLQSAGAVGAMLWCFTDYHPSTWDSPPLDHAIHERSFGLWRADGSEKPSVAAVSAACGRPTRPRSAHPWIDIEPREYWQRPGAQLTRLYRRYRAVPPPRQ
jgi:endo-1,4-beta-mannosidase